MERSRLINRRLMRFVAPASQPAFLAFLKRIFAGSGKQVCEATFLKEDGKTFWASLNGTSASLPAARGNGAWLPFPTSLASSRLKKRNAAWKLWRRPTGR